MTKTLSIIIPSCNMERYMDQCIQSLLIPSIADIEILVINDGSKDRTSEIAHGYEAQYPLSIRVIDKPNGHYGSCINRGLKEVSGKYVKVLDADDSFDKVEFEQFVKFLKKTDADIVFSDYCIVDETGITTATKTFPRLESAGTTNFNNALPLFLSANMAMHGVAYRTTLLKDINYRQTEGVAYTDQEWIFVPIFYVSTVAHFPHIVYRYLVGRTGQSVDSSVITKAMALQMELFSKRLDDFANLADMLSKEQREYAFMRMKYSMVNRFKCILFGTNTERFASELLAIDRRLQTVFPELFHDLGKERLKGWLPFKYITYWRNRFPKGRPMPVINIIKRINRQDY